MAAERSHGNSEAIIEKANKKLDHETDMGELEPNGGETVCVMEPKTVNAKTVNAETADSEMMDAEMMELMAESERLMAELTLLVRLIERGIGNRESQQRVAERISKKLSENVKRKEQKIIETQSRTC